MSEIEMLIGLLERAQIGLETIGERFYKSAIKILADNLLENGVIVPPCKVGTHLYRITHPYRKSPKVTEYVVKNFRTFGKKHKLQIEVQALNVPITNWMIYTDFYATKEEAEKALQGGTE